MRMIFSERTELISWPAYFREVARPLLCPSVLTLQELCVLLIAGGGLTPFKYLQSTEEAQRAIEAVLAADPRSVYRRKLCQDRLFYFTVDTVHVTCWFGDCFAEVLRVQPTSGPPGVTTTGDDSGPLES